MPMPQEPMPDANASPARSALQRIPWSACGLVVALLLALAGSVTGRSALAGMSLLLVLALWLPRLWRARSAASIGLWLACALALGAAVFAGRAQLAWMALPILVPAGVAALFGRSLRGGREPLVARFIRVIEGDARLALPGVRAYARGVTVFWTCVPAGIAALSLALALFAVPGGWLAALGVEPVVRLPGGLLAWYPEAGCWLLLAATFAGEYVFRRWWLAGVPQLGPARFIARLVRRWPELLRDECGPA